MTSCNGIPKASIFDMVMFMVALGSRRLRRWRSVLMVSGGKPWAMAGTAMWKRKEALPWPKSKITPRSRACQTKVEDAVLVVEHGCAHGVAVGVDVAGAVAGEQFGVGAGGFG